MQKDISFVLPVGFQGQSMAKAANTRPSVPAAPPMRTAPVGAAAIPLEDEDLAVEFPLAAPLEEAAVVAADAALGLD